MKAVEENVFFNESSLRSLHLISDAFNFNWHYHEEFEISLCLQGRGIRYTGDVIENYNAQEMLFIPSNLSHSWQTNTEGPHEAYILQFRKNFLGADITGCKDMRSIQAMLNETRSQKIQLTEELIELTKKVHSDSGIERLSSFLKLLDKINHAPKTYANEFSPRILSKKLDAKFHKVMESIQNNWGDEISVPELAENCHMSESTFRRFFKRTTGKSFVNFHNTLKISYACECLINTNHSVTYISDMAGFRNLTFFNRKFKDIKGMTPREYRRQHEQQIVLSKAAI